MLISFFSVRESERWRRGGKCSEFNFNVFLSLSVGERKTFPALTAATIPLSRVAKQQHKNEQKMITILCVVRPATSANPLFRSATLFIAFNGVVLVDRNCGKVAEIFSASRFVRRHTKVRMSSEQWKNIIQKCQRLRPAGIELLHNILSIFNFFTGVWRRTERSSTVAAAGSCLIAKWSWN